MYKVTAAFQMIPMDLVFNLNNIFHSSVRETCVNTQLRLLVRLLNNDFAGFV